MELEEIISDHYNRIIDNYEVVEHTYDFDSSVDYHFTQKKTGDVYIKLTYSPAEPSIVIRLLGVKGICLIKKKMVNSLSELNDLSIEEVVHLIDYIDIQGDPPFRYAVGWSDYDQTMEQIYEDDYLQLQLAGSFAEIRLALQFLAHIDRKKTNS